MPNRLARESSPYLLQHQDNPVDWYPWGPEALALARSLERPIFLSIGYSACHWCHVMEHESFEDPQIAAQLNAHFVSIKVDREERPDLDQIYMSAVQMLTGRGGWPMSVFLTPELKPFYGGTYWPPTSRHGLPGFGQVIEAVAAAWRTNRTAALATAEQLTQEIRSAAQLQVAAGELTRDLVEQAAIQFERTFDHACGGFGGAPKFPAPLALRLLMRIWQRKRNQTALDMVRTTLDRMAGGGIYDHLGGGFARYSVDAQWLVPHFEKMLYDNAQLTLAYLEAYQITAQPSYAQVVRETLDYVLRDMTDPQGGFYSSEDADSEGVEGKFYTWTPAELQQVLSPEAAATFARVYDVTGGGNFEGRNILHLPKTLAQQAALLQRPEEELAAELAVSRAKLFAAREDRIHPHKDDKVLTAWNGLLIEACAAAGAVLGEPRYLAAAERAADFLWEHLRRNDGRLLHTWRQGTAKLDAYLDDYACLASGLMGLYEAGFQARHLERAAELAEVLLARFADPISGGFFFTADDQEQLILRNKEFADNATPSGNALAAWFLGRLGKLTGRQGYLEAAARTLEAAGELLHRYPSACCQSLLAVDLLLGPIQELVFAGDLSLPATRQTLWELQRRFLPHKVLALADAQAPPVLQELVAGKTSADGEPVLYVCEGFSCQAPVRGAVEIEELMARMDG